MLIPPLPWFIDAELDVTYFYSVLGTLVGFFSAIVVGTSGLVAMRIGLAGPSSQTRRMRAGASTVLSLVFIIPCLPLATGSTVEAWSAPMFYQNFVHLALLSNFALVLSFGLGVSKWEERKQSHAEGNTSGVGANGAGLSPSGVARVCPDRFVRMCFAGTRRVPTIVWVWGSPIAIVFIVGGGGALVESGDTVLNELIDHRFYILLGAYCSSLFALAVVEQVRATFYSPD